MFILELLTLGLIALVGIGWQIAKFESLKSGNSQSAPIAMIVPVLLGITLLIGLTAHYVLDYNFNNGIAYASEGSFSNLFGLIFKTSFFLWVKSLFSPIVVSVLLMMIVYSLFEPGPFEFWSFEFFRELMTWITSGLPDWARSAYVIAMYLVSVRGALEL